MTINDLGETEKKKLEAFLWGKDRKASSRKKDLC